MACGRFKSKPVEVSPSTRARITRSSLDSSRVWLWINFLTLCTHTFISNKIFMTHKFSDKGPLNIVAALVKKLDFPPLFCSFISTITGFFFFLSKATVSSCRHYLLDVSSRLTRKCTETMALTFLDQINGIRLTPSSVQITLNLFRMIGKQLLSDHLSWTVAQGFKCNL